MADRGRGCRSRQESFRATSRSAMAEEKKVARRVEGEHPRPQSMWPQECGPATLAQGCPETPRQWPWEGHGRPAPAASHQPYLLEDQPAEPFSGFHAETRREAEVPTLSTSAVTSSGNRTFRGITK